MPEWLGSAWTGAVIAALGFVSKLIIEAVLKWNATRLARRARLVELLSLLLASRKAFLIQCELRDSLCKKILVTHPELNGETYDEILAKAYPSLDDRQKLDHGLIRNYTINCMYPLNSQTLDWLSKDDYFKGGGVSPEQKKLAKQLELLYAHMIMWRAKYEFWIPNRPERTIVYLEDENRHGVGFPTGIEELIAKAADNMNMAFTPDPKQNPSEPQVP